VNARGFGGIAHRQRGGGCGSGEKGRKKIKIFYAKPKKVIT
jgi:hypothetical protein